MKNLKRKGSKPRVLLLNPPQRFMVYDINFSTYVPIGLLSIAAVIREFCTVEVYDCLIEDFNIECRRGIVGIYKNFGATRTNIAKKLRDFQPDIIGITLPISRLAFLGLNVSGLCKAFAPGAIRVLGGGHATLRYETLLKEGWCDYCVVGEGEMSFLDLINAYQSGESIKDIPGIASWDGEKVQYRERNPIQDIDDLPYPAYDLIDMDKYQKSPYLYQSADALNRDRQVSMITSRGCPYKCIFCIGKTSLGKKLRFHSASYIVNHLQYLKEHYGITYVYFNDDNISNDREHYEALLDLLIERNLGIRWSAPNGFRADTLTPELIRKTVASGCARLSLAFESGNQRILNQVVRKNLDLKKSQWTAKECCSAGIDIYGFFMIGIPGETVKNMKQTIDLAVQLYEKHGVMPLLFRLEPFIGTPVHLMYAERGILPEQDQVTEIEYQLMLAANNWKGRSDSFNHITLNKVYSVFDKRMVSAFEKKHNLKLVFQKKGTEKIATVSYDGREGNMGNVERFMKRSLEERGLMPEGPILKTCYRRYCLPENPSFKHEVYKLKVQVKPAVLNMADDSLNLSAIFQVIADKFREVMLKRHESFLFRDRYVIKFLGLIISLIYKSPFLQRATLSWENSVLNWRKY